MAAKRLLLVLGILFAPAVRAESLRDVVDSLDVAAYQKELSFMTGVKPVKIGSSTVTLPDRFMPENVALVRRYIEQRLKGMGYSRVHAEDFEIDGLKEPYVKENPASRSHGRNLWIESPGTSLPEEIVTLGAHYDSTGKGMPGANDNGSGFVAALQIAEAFRGKRPKRTVRIVFFDGEEMPPYFQGSKDFFEKSAKKGEKNVLFLNLDQIGFNPSGSSHVGFAAKYQPKVKALLTAANAEAGLGIKMVAYDPYLSDNLSATRVGIPTASFFEEGKDGRGRTIPYEHYHRGTDVASRVNPDYAVKVTKWAAASLFLAADGADTYDNSPRQKISQYRQIAEGFRDDDEPKTAALWDRFATSCERNFSRVR